MNLHRLRPTSLAQAGSQYRGRCAECGELLTYRQEVVNLYGEAFHHDCAFHLPHRSSSLREGGDRPG
jgi:hypothetical protein